MVCIAGPEDRHGGINVDENRAAGRARILNEAGMLIMGFFASLVPGTMICLISRSSVISTCLQILSCAWLATMLRERLSKPPDPVKVFLASECHSQKGREVFSVHNSEMVSPAYCEQMQLLRFPVEDESRPRAPARILLNSLED